MVALHVVKYHTNGGRTKYSVRLRLTTTKTTLHENTSGWEVVGAVDDAMLTLEKRIKKDHERRVDVRTRGGRE
jgi:ribosome-associated translation inhibitor RaiA